MIDLVDKQLLIITPDYPDEKNIFTGCNYVKRMLDETHSCFKEVNVIAPVLSTFGKTPQSKYCKDYSYDNVNVYCPTGYYIPNITPGGNTWWQPYVDFRYNAIISTIKEHDIHFDLIHAQFAYMSGDIAYKLHQLYQVPYIISIYEDTQWMHHLINTWGLKYTVPIQNADAVICINNIDAAYLNTINPTTLYIPAGYTSEKFKQLPESKDELKRYLIDPPNQKMIISVGNIEKRKRFDILINAVCDINRCNGIFPLVCFIIGRDKGEQKYLTELIKQRHAELDIHILNNVPDEDLVKYMNAADVLTVQSDSEGFGVTQVEAWACGTPVVATDNNGSLSLFCKNINNVLGELFSINNGDKSMQRALINVLMKPPNREMLVKESEKYRWTTIAEQLKNVYVTTMGKT
jgi:glycosyltransferase involved in cell wall biosynthesis